MKKALIFLLLLTALALTVISCAPTGSGGEGESESTSDVTETENPNGETPVTGIVGGFSTQFICMNEGQASPSTNTRLFSSQRQFANYSQSNLPDGEVVVPGAEDVFLDQTTQLSALLAKYDELFFNDHYLVLIRIDEENSAMRHRVTDVEVRNVREQSRLCVDIVRLEPQYDTEVPGYWYLFLELDRNDLSLDSAQDIYVKIGD